MNGGWDISYEIALRWMPQDFADDKSTLVQVMAWCHQATSHYLSQCWPRSMSPYGVTRPQWVNHYLRASIRALVIPRVGAVRVSQVHWRFLRQTTRASQCVHFKQHFLYLVLNLCHGKLLKSFRKRLTLYVLNFLTETLTCIYNLHCTSQVVEILSRVR